MVLTSDGEVLTNNHVVDGATSITVTVLSTGESYRATVVGTDPTDDVAVLQLTDASGLDTVQTDEDGVAVGDDVTAVGNAGNEIGTSAAAGSVTGVDQSITATDESGSDAEQLTGLIEIAADVQAGDSGGPLYDAGGEVVGMDTAASSAAADRPTRSRSTPPWPSPTRSPAAWTTRRSTRATRRSSASPCCPPGPPTAPRSPARSPVARPTRRA